MIPPYAIGSTEWPGLAKLAEECGELLQVIGKLMAYPHVDHPDGGDTIRRLHDEVADVRAAMIYAVNANQLDVRYIVEREIGKIERFEGWHTEARA